MEKGKKKRNKTDETCADKKDALETSGKDPKGLPKNMRIRTFIIRNIIYLKWRLWELPTVSKYRGSHPFYRELDVQWTNVVVF